MSNWKEEFNKKYDFSENKTLEYDNLLTIIDFIEQLLLSDRDELIKMLDNQDAICSVCKSGLKILIKEQFNK